MTVFLKSESFERLKADLIHLKTVGRKEAGDALAEAREKGDLSENAEYDAAKEEQAKLEKRIAILETALSDVRILEDKDIDINNVSILTFVKLLNHKNNNEYTYQIVSEIEADYKQSKLSISSPLGKGLLGCKKGDTTEIHTPAGPIKYEIIEISK